MKILTPIIGGDFLTCKKTCKTICQNIILNQVN